MAQDRSGPALKQEILKTEPNAVILEKIVPDSQNSIKTQLIEWSQSCNVIFTTGGTGFAPRLLKDRNRCFQYKFLQILCMCV